MLNDLPFRTATIALVGVGLIGGSLGLALKHLGIGKRILGVSRKETLAQAEALGVVDGGFEYDALEDAVSEADLVILCTPIFRILDLLPGVLQAVPPGAVVSDVGSTKREIVARAVALARKDVHFIGGHPMAGSEHSGVSAADPFLFQNAIYVVTPAPEVPEEICSRFVALVRALGARPMQLDPDTHDRVAASVSHLPQMMATTLVGMVGQLNEADGLPLQMAAGGFRDLTRIASSPYEMWRDICRTNAGPIREMIDRYMEALAEVRAAVDNDRLEAAFEYANDVRGRIPKDSKGFLHPLYEILLVVEDQPGVIAGVANVLSDAGINIDDIEVLKVREGEGGTIRMGFDGKEVAQRAVGLLSDAGYRVRMR
ncbi:MAG: prephenate dehydrogenase [bacterium]|nr:prephenate dehydrogenase [bacterium]